ncbi:hypothetical protein CCAN12_520017 [Capnocytophaga canimorsus]|uniref:Uncharacterized protein n=1 Tax=Capnocytophaga canimorsus TaxID=28188 RepID=A0A0B7H3U9_9FLAO|nr:hypothetical protein CCAN12_520017 [Capnocytophaga canimorsus]
MYLSDDPIIFLRFTKLDNKFFETLNYPSYFSKCTLYYCLSMLFIVFLHTVFLFRKPCFSVYY